MEANSIATAYTPHPCTSTGRTRCDSSGACTSTCDQAGCDFNSYRMGDKTFYGKGPTVDTSRRSPSSPSSSPRPARPPVRCLKSASCTCRTARLSRTRRQASISGGSAYDSVSDALCSAQKTAFGDTNTFSQKGGFGEMSKAFNTGIVLVLSIWGDHAANMLWLDSNCPTDRPATQLGVARDNCATTSGVPADVESQSPNAQVIYSNIKFGTYTGTA